MRSHRATVVGWVVTVLATGLAVVLFVLARQSDPADYRESIATVRAIQQLAADWSIETARVRADPLADFDSLAAYIPRMDELKQRLLRTVRTIPDMPDRLANDASAYVNAVEAREERIERFKTGYAIIRNSARYLPLAASNIVQAPGVDADLAREVSALASDIGGYLTAPSDAVKGRLTVALERLGDRVSGMAPPLPDSVANFIAHADVLLAQQAPTGELFAQATSTEISDLSASLVDALGAEVGRRNAAIGGYLNGIIAAAVVLVLVWLVVVALRLRTRGTAEQEAVPAVAAGMATAVAEAPRSAPVEDWARTRRAMTHRIVAARVAALLAADSGRLVEEIDALEVDTSDESDVVRAIRGPDFRLRVEEGDVPHKRLLDAMAAIGSEAGRLAAFAGRDGGGSYALVDLDECVRLVVDESGAADDAVEVAIDSAGPTEVFAAAADVRLMLGNVVENSLRAIAAAHREHGELRIAIGTDGDMAAVTVIDNGIGMTPETRARIFEPFFSLEGDRDGVGLVCTDYLVEKYGGAISVSSVVDGGTVTRIQLPAMTGA